TCAERLSMRPKKHSAACLPQKHSGTTSRTRLTFPSGRSGRSAPPCVQHNKHKADETRATRAVRRKLPCPAPAPGSHPYAMNVHEDRNVRQDREGQHATTAVCLVRLLVVRHGASVRTGCGCGSGGRRRQGLRESEGPEGTEAHDPVELALQQ